jgi:hypothetical protein
MLGLDFVLASCARNASGTGACSWGDGDANRANREPPHHSSTETAEPSFGNRRFWFGAALTGKSGRKTPNACDMSAFQAGYLAKSRNSIACRLVPL